MNIFIFHYEFYFFLFSAALQRGLSRYVSTICYISIILFFGLFFFFCIHKIDVLIRYARKLAFLSPPSFFFFRTVFDNHFASLKINKINFYANTKPANFSSTRLKLYATKQKKIQLISIIADKTEYFIIFIHYRYNFLFSSFFLFFLFFWCASFFLKILLSNFTSLPNWRILFNAL